MQHISTQRIYMLLLSGNKANGTRGRLGIKVMRREEFQQKVCCLFYNFIVYDNHHHRLAIATQPVHPDEGNQNTNPITVPGCLVYLQIVFFLSATQGEMRKTFVLPCIFKGMSTNSKLECLIRSHSQHLIKWEDLNSLKLIQFWTSPKHWCSWCVCWS